MRQSNPTITVLGMATVLALAGCDRDAAEPAAGAASPDGTAAGEVALSDVELIEALVEGRDVDALASPSATDPATSGEPSAAEATPDAPDEATTAAVTPEATSVEVTSVDGVGALSAPADGAGADATVADVTTTDDDPSAALPPDTLGEAAVLEALVAPGEIPYPLYPNGEKYRVGGENGLKIVLFETVDSFEEVDAYYRERSDGSGMPRLAAMSDYVRYGASDDDTDPWATHRPGIVIHRFNDESERDAVGADETARTNIIMSY